MGWPYQSNNRLVLTVKKDIQSPISTMNQVNSFFCKQSIGIINRDISEEIFLENGGQEEKLHRLNSGSSLLQMLVANRVAAIYYKHFQTFYYIKTLGYEESDFKSIYVNASSTKNQDGYFAFHKDTESKLVERFQMAFKTLEEKGVVPNFLLNTS